MRASNIPALVLACMAIVPLPGWAQDGAGRNFTALEHLCAPVPERGAREDQFAEKMAKDLLLSDAQKALFKDVQDARAKALDAAKTRFCAKGRTCPISRRA